ncbi:MAG TPA: 2Fe-2S iron-sulfur cluster-binding protein [Chthonomonadales bacterium]|nr:2Fe-2S iron-sulfur cluster-binding protein [Chthonomonadales bacterium]
MTFEPRNGIEISIDGRSVPARVGATILETLCEAGVETPTLCYLETLTPVNACRLCVVELQGSRALVPACSRKVEAGMTVSTDSARVRRSRKMVLELLASSVDLSLAEPNVNRWMEQYGAKATRFGPAASPAPAGARDRRDPGHHHPAQPGTETVAQPVKIDNDLYVRDYSKCILCYKCVEACGADAQNTCAIAVAGRGFDAGISTEFGVPLTDSACVYCGNCIAVCPTGALMAKSEFDMRLCGEWDESAQTVTETICPYCGVGCTLQLHVQDNRIVKATSPLDHDVTRGNLCIKGRFGWEFVRGAAREERRHKEESATYASEQAP